ncbi:hypothetical protein [Halioxenophilus sp. WMMB6]|uniref:hypothetical protein n=1 Tax=Halioxenophilus sp. WMMB6 TaxID=3073815 RepID=UPI00295E64FC|nr:hypothetical protein [Halioxenophilus sp. WMMB6]
MAFGDNPCDPLLQDAWRAFCSQLQQAGEQVFKESNPSNALQRADGFRFLTQNLGQAFDLALETKNSRYPALHPFCSPSRKLGGDAADFTYHQAWIDGQSVYRVSGNIGSARFINFTIQGARPETVPGTEIPSLHDPFGDIPEANLFGHQLAHDSDGNFELFIGGPERGLNWLPTTSNSRKLFLRQGFDGWQEQPARLHIERIDMREPRPLPTPTEMVHAMQWAGTFVSQLMQQWPDHPYQYSPFVDPAQVNQFPPDPNANTTADDQKRGRAIAHLCWQLARDEALIIEFDAHDGFWMLTNAGAFMNSMDFLYRPVSYTPARTRVDRDGKIRIVVCEQEPGFFNWLDTCGFEQGNITYRNLLSLHNTQFTTQVVKREALEAVLANTSSRVTREERIAELYHRSRSVAQRYFF